MDSFDVVVIGGGPGGYAAAVRASRLGPNTALAGKEDLSLHLVGSQVAEPVAGVTGMTSLNADAAQLTAAVHSHPRA